jgi:hypothetical protein
MADLDLSVEVNRDALALTPLDIAQPPYYLAASPFLSSQVSWDRQTVSSRWIDGEVTTSRKRGMVMETIAVEVVATDMATLQDYMQTLIEALCQDTYTMTITVDGTLWVYNCEAADYTNLMWTTPRLVAAQGQAQFTVPRRPVAAVGV